VHIDPPKTWGVRDIDGPVRTAVEVLMAALKHRMEAGSAAGTRRTMCGYLVFGISPRGCRIRDLVFDNTVTAEAPSREDDMKYIALLYGEPDAGPAPGTPEFMEMLGEFESATAAMAVAGILVDSSPLQPPQTAITVRVRNGETLLSDGPFAEIKEQLGGYYILDCEDLDAALRYVAAIPSAKYGAIEVRPLMVMGSH
jgi:hypothetical protein